MQQTKKDIPAVHQLELLVIITYHNMSKMASIDDNNITIDNTVEYAASTPTPTFINIEMFHGVCDGSIYSAP